MKILDVRIDNFSRDEVLAKIESFLSDGKFHQIATVNAEFILQAQKDGDFKNILNNCDLNIADSISINFAFLRFRKWLKTRIAGADLMHEILRMANEKKLSVFLVANKNGLSSWEETREALSVMCPNIKFDGVNLDYENSYELRVTSYKIILCALGAPFQEKFLNSLKNDIMGVAIGVGGSFDFATGKIKRAPKIMRIFGLEWLYRLFQEPKYRLKRIINAVIVFPIKVIFDK